MNLFTRIRKMRDEATATLDHANNNLFQARAARQVAIHTAGRLRSSGEENHFRKAVEFQLRGIRHP